MQRIVCWFSCGAASAVATKLAIAKYGLTHEIVIARCVVREEHTDNDRFTVDCEKWFGMPITEMLAVDYDGSVYNVITKRKYISGNEGAPCTMLLKKRVREVFQRPDDLHIFGYCAEEQGRFDDFLDANNIDVEVPPIDRQLSHANCLAMIQDAGIELPTMYKLGYQHNNCIGCVKGGLGYFRAIREDFPQQFERLAQAEDKVAALHGEGAYILRHRSGPLKGQRFPLRELPSGKPHRGEPLPSCGLFCETAEKEYAA